MFPPLCFIDITRGLTSEKTDSELKRVLDDDEIESITAFKQTSQKQEVAAKSGIDKAKALVNSPGSSKSFKPNVEFKYKSLEIIEDTYNKVKHMLK